MNEQFVIAFSTFPDVETARKISRELVDSALVACANIIPAVESIYYWKEKVETSAESLAIFKLTAARYSEFESRLRNAASVRCPRNCPPEHRGRLGRLSSLDWRELFAPVIPSSAEGSRCESLKVTSTGSLDCARDDGGF